MKKNRKFEVINNSWIKSGSTQIGNSHQTNTHAIRIVSIKTNTTHVITTPNFESHIRLLSAFDIGLFLYYGKGEEEQFNVDLVFLENLIIYNKIED